MKASLLALFYLIGGSALQQVTAIGDRIVSVEADQDDYTYMHNERSEHGHRHLRKNPPGPQNVHITAPHKGGGPPLREFICHWDEDRQEWTVKKIPVPALKGHVGHGDCICGLDCPCIPATPGSSDMICIGPAASKCEAVKQLLGGDWDDDNMICHDVDVLCHPSEVLIFSKVLQSWDEHMAFMTAVNVNISPIATLQFYEPRTPERQDCFDTVLDPNPPPGISPNYGFLGGRQDDIVAADNLAHGWHWESDGAPFTFTAWRSDQPNDWPTTDENGEQDCLGQQLSGEVGWNDYHCANHPLTAWYQIIVPW